MPCVSTCLYKTTLASGRAAKAELSFHAGKHVRPLGLSGRCLSHWLSQSLTQGCLHLRAGPGSTTWLSSCSACGSGLLIGTDFDIFRYLSAIFSAIFSHSASFLERHVESNHVKSCLVEKRESTIVNSCDRGKACQWSFREHPLCYQRWGAAPEAIATCSIV